MKTGLVFLAALTFMVLAFSRAPDEIRPAGLERPVPADLRRQSNLDHFGQSIWPFRSAERSNRRFERAALPQRRGASTPSAFRVRQPVEQRLPAASVPPPLDRSIGHIESSNPGTALQPPRQRHARKSEAANPATGLYHLALPLVSLVLCAIAGYLVLRLRLHAGRLRWRLALEQSVHEAISSFSHSKLYDGSMDEVLNRLREAFGYRSLCVARLDPRTLRVLDSRGSQPRGEDGCALVDRFIAEWTVAGQALPEVTSELRADCGIWMRLPRLRQRAAPDLVACVVPTYDSQVVMLAAEMDPALRASGADLQIFRMAAELLARAIEKHARMAELDELKRRLEEAQRLDGLGVFASGIAHEFNNLLTAMMGYAEMVLSVLDRKSDSYSHVEHILGAGRRARLVVDQIHAVSRSRQTAPKPFELVDAVLEIMPVLYLSVSEGVRLEIELPDPPMVMAGASIEIQQMLVNLCKNAGEALLGIEGDRRVTLAVSSVEFDRMRSLSHGELGPGAYVQITVSDNGPGISPENLSKIFQPFFTTKKHSGGTGLGLSIVHGMVKSLKGALDLRSTPGAGTRFDLFFPVVANGQALMEDPLGSPGMTIGNGEMVGIVDPVEKSRLKWEELVALLGYEPISCPTTHDLVRLCRATERKPHLVLVDNSSDGLSSLSDGDLAPLDQGYWIHVSETGELPGVIGTPSVPRMALAKPVNPNDLASLLAGLLGPATMPQEVGISAPNGSARPLVPASVFL